MWGITQIKADLDLTHRHNKKDIGAKPLEEHNTSLLKGYNLPFMRLIRVIKSYGVFSYVPMTCFLTLLCPRTSGKYTIYENTKKKY